MSGMYITTSWDDGHPLDLRVADMLNQYDIVGTFYVAKDYLDTRLSESEIRELSKRHEIGAHTMTHPVLTDISLDQARIEIEDSKKWLEDVIGTEVTAFCYPKGAQSAALRKITQEAGFHIARGVEQYSLSPGSDPFNLSTTLQIYPFPLRPLPKQPFYRGLPTRLKPFRTMMQHRKKLQIGLHQMKSWSDLAIATVTTSAKQNAIWHLWGHSWEIEKYDLWVEFERALAHIQEMNNTIPIVNSALIEHLDKQE